MEEQIKIELSPEDRFTLRVGMARMNAYKQLAQAEEASIAWMIQTKYGVDLQKENWDLDVESGVLVHVPHPEQ